MTAKSHNRGNEIVYNNIVKRWENNGEELLCSKCGKTPVEVKLCRKRKYSKLETAKIDPCIANLVKVLNQHGVHTLNSCCGHGTLPGEIIYEQKGKRYTLKLNKVKN